MCVIGERIKAERKARAWTQADLAGHSGISAGYLALLETNRRPNPTGETLQRLATAFGITVDELLHGPPEPDAETPPLAELRAVGWPEHRLADLDQIWPELTPRERAGHLRRARALYAEWQQIDQMRRHLRAEVEAQQAELDRGEPLQHGQAEAFPMQPKLEPI